MREKDPDKQDKKTEGRFTRHRRIASEVYAEPRSVGRLARKGLITLWVAHGAGFYGLGWIVAFCVLEFNMFTGDIVQSEGVTDFITNQLLEYVLRIGLLSFLNTLLAAIWPVYVLQWWSGYGLVVLVAGYFGFEKLLRPIVESQFPELREAREQARKNKVEKKKKKTEK
jgi:hypothetical protein